MLFIGSLLFVALIGVGVAMLVRAFRGPPPDVADAPSSPAALQFLHDRYARGEIDREEFQERRSILLR